MSEIDDLIEQECARSEEFAAAFAQESEKLEIAVAMVRLRDELGLSQKQLAAKSGKPQSTIARIENGTLNPSVGLLAEIAASVGKTLDVKFGDDPSGMRRRRSNQRTRTFDVLDGLVGAAPVAQGA